MVIAAFVQARMSSRRFPGKTLAPFRGRPVIAHVLDRVRSVSAIDPTKVVLLTSTDSSDDPLASYVGSLGVEVHRGPVDDVFARFQRCAAGRGAEWIARINGDSPLMSPMILEAVIASAGADWDVVTTIMPRTLPKGQNPELIRAETLLRTDPAKLSADHREHVTQYYYQHPEEFRIASLHSNRPELADLNFSIDTVEDLRRLEAMPQAEIDRLLQVSFV
jgi:Spore coat polysaccharide biosynthesis protein F, CMP-KDO synthetase homolog